MIQSKSSSNKKVFVAMSGGVDSSVAALLTRDSGQAIQGVHLRLFPADNEQARARIESAEADARRVAEKLDIPLTVLDLRETFQKKVVEPFIRAYLQGRTPNPCCLCNPTIKMGALLEWAREQGSDAVATGHYARVEPFPPTGLPTLRRAVYVKKDQTYFLSHLGVDALSGFITPVGHLQKEDVRRVAREAGLPVAERSESQEICFIADDNYRRFLQENSEDMGDSEDMAGEIVNMEGKALGRHAGIHHYTIGQRRGLGIGGSPEPIYVVELRPETKQVVVGPNEALFSKGLLADKMHYGGLGEIREPTPVRVKIRYRSEAVNATATPEDKGSLRIVFKTPQRAVTPGQTAAVYDCEGEWVIGGGEIFKSL